MKIATLATFIALAGCATTGRMFDQDTGTRGGTLTLQTVSSDDATTTFPALLSAPALPSADRQRRELAGIEKLSATVNMCVAPTGAVAEVQLAASSGTPTFDDAAVRDPAAWRYEPFRAPSNIRVCKPLTLLYTPR